MQANGYRDLLLLYAGRALRPPVLAGALLALVLGTAIWYVSAQGSAPPDLDTFLLEGMRACHEGTERQTCLASFASDLADRYAAADVLESLAAYETSQQIFVEDCHALAHNFGRERYERTGSVSAVFAEGSPVCLAGIFHGALEGYFIEKRQGAYDLGNEETRVLVADVCEPKDSFKTEWEYGNCYHGLGHALMFFTDNDLPRALDFCSAVNFEDKRLLCYDGALMENDSAAKGVHPSAYYRADDPYYPCPILDAPYQRECYTYGIAHRFQGDTVQSAEVCRDVPSEYRLGCFFSTGLHAVMNTVDPEVIARKCESIPEEEFMAACVEGAAASLALRVTPESGVTLAFCALLDARVAGACYETGIAAIREKIADPPAREALCEAITRATYRARCLSGG